MLLCLLVMFFEPGQIIFEGFNALLKRRFPFPGTMDKDYIFSLSEGIKLLAEFLYMLHFYGIAINNPSTIELFALCHKISKFYQKLCLIFGYSLFPDKSVFVCGCFYFCAVYKNGFT